MIFLDGTNMHTLAGILWTHARTMSPVKAAGFEADTMPRLVKRGAHVLMQRVQRGEQPSTQQTPRQTALTVWRTKLKEGARIALIIVVGILASALLPVQGAIAQVISIDIQEGRVDPIPVAIPAPLIEGRITQEGQKVVAAILQVMRSDVANSGLLRLIRLDKIDQNNIDDKTASRLLSIGAQHVLVSSVSIRGKDVSTRATLWNVLTRSVVFSRNYTTALSNWRTSAHVIANDVYAQLTGEPPYFNSRILFIAETGPDNNRSKRLAIMDQDGHGVRYLTKGNQIVLTPRFSPDGEHISYLSIYKRQAAVYIFNLRTGAFERIGRFKGMTFAPRFSPDGKFLAMSHAEDGNTDLYLYDLTTRRSRRLTKDPNIDTSPSFSPDGKSIAFTSDREGTAQIYVMTLANLSVRRVSLGEGRYFTPVWSPRGDLIAFTKTRGDGKFYIGVMAPNGTKERLITSSYLVEGPDWAPNGRSIVFTKQPSPRKRDPRLHVVDITGYYERVLATPSSASDPAWSAEFSGNN